MKTYVFILCLAISLLSCQSSSDGLYKSRNDSAALALISPPAPLHPSEARRYHEVISDFIDNHLSAQHFNGGILVAKNGVVVYERYTGYSDLQKKQPMSAETPMQIASTGKTLTSGAILKLVQERKMNLDDAVTKYFPAFPYTEVTVKMLLNHRSGLPEYLYYMEKMGWNRKIPATNQDVLNTLINWHPPYSYTPGKHYNYCNTNFVLLALIIEKVSGVSYPQYMKDNFFTPLHMDHSFVKTVQDSDVVNSYQPNGATWALDFSDGPYGDKNIYSTPRDLLQWDQAIYEGRLINSDLLDSAFTPYSNERPGVKNYGLGWHLLMLPNSKKVIFHNGRWHGFNAAFARLTDEHVTIIMTCNKMNMGVYQISKKMYNLFGPYDGKNDDPGED